MAGPFSRSALVLCLACWAVPALAADAPVIRNKAQLEAVLASSQPTPLDALTPYGKRSFLRAMRWSETGEPRGFSYLAIVRELDRQQLASLLAFLDSSEQLEMFQRQLVGTLLRLPEPSSDIEQRLLEFVRIGEDEAERRNATATSGASVRSPTAQLQHYTRLFGKRMDAAALRRQPLGDLLPLFEAAWRMEFNHPGTALPDMLRVHQELVTRGVDTRRMLDGDVLQALTTMRMFDQARAFAAARPDLGTRAIPKVEDPLGSRFAGRSLYRYDRAAHTLIREAAPVPKGTQVIMVVDAGCRFSANALAALRADAGLQARLREANLLILTPPSSGVPFHFISEWNAANPSMPMGVPADLAAWRAIDGDNVPRFFVLKDGKVLGRANGWPEEGNKLALLSLLDAARD